MQVRLVPREAPEGDAAAAAAVPPPQPHSPAVALEVAGGEVVAVARIEGNVTPEVSLCGWLRMAMSWCIDFEQQRELVAAEPLRGGRLTNLFGDLLAGGGGGAAAAAGGAAGRRSEAGGG